MEKAVGVLRRMDAAGYEQSRYDLGKFQSLSQPPRRLRLSAGGSRLRSARLPAHAYRSSSPVPSPEPSIMIPPRSSAISCSDRYASYHSVESSQRNMTP